MLNLFRSQNLAMKGQSDPNGIRTRVTAVKGRCPGPLDDRVTKARAISGLPFFHARQIAGEVWILRTCPCFQSGHVLPHSKGEIPSVIRFDLVNQRRCARSRALMRVQNCARVLDKALPRIAVVQKPGDCPFEIIGVPNLDCALF